ncbi:MAG: hypothetical protein K8H84_11845 [Sulfuricella denitrificans]|nr:hypothetical protein [Sulfuricella denitrificans]
MPGRILLAITLAAAAPAYSASLCYDVEQLPVVVKIRDEGHQIRVFPLAKASGNQYLSSTLVFSETGGWRQGGQISCPNAVCDDTPLKYPGLSGETVTDCQIRNFPVERVRKDAEKHTSLRGDQLEQNTASCIRQGGKFWFGISYYAGEGIGGVGGVGRYDPNTGRLEIRRPKVLRETSVHHVAHDGKSLWLGTAGFYECIGDAPTQGLLRYEWDSGRFESFKGKRGGPCGFVVNDLLWRAGQLWVATELGLAQWNAKNDTWINYLPAPGASPPIRETRCEDLYAASLDKLKPGSGEYERLGLDSPYFLFYETLKAFRPDFIHTYRNNHP